jgi:uncharacterized protein YdeI (YjbR/CyaY-like superfamily)
MEKAQKPEFEILLFENLAAWTKWLEEHHSSTDGVWLRFAKKASSLQSLSYAEAVEGALCYGWIDGQAKSYDADSWLQKYTPRRAKSIWSKINREKVMKLIAEGRMQPSGLQEIERAKADGRWDAAYDSMTTAQVPEDLQAALDANPAAQQFFATLTGSNRYAILFRIQTAKKAETRARRIQQFVEMLGRGEKIHS